MKQTTMVKLAAMIPLVMAASEANAAIALDRTRVVFPGDQKSVSMTITNENKQLPYLAQGWLENEKEEKINEPLLVLPPVQRVEPGAKTQVKIQAEAGIAALPKDRESLFYFNLREIPPRSNKPNVLQLALQTKIKLFYRPAALIVPVSTTTPWQESLTLTRDGNRYIAHNPTGYYITINDAQAQEGKSAAKFRAVMIPPKSDMDLGVSADALGNSPKLEYINDFGGRPLLSFKCNGGTCSVSSNKVDG